MPKKQRNVVISWSDVKTTFMDCVTRGKPYPGSAQQPMADTIRGWAASYERGDKGNRDGWEGGSIVNTVDFVRNGYYADKMMHSAEMVPQGIRKRMNWSDIEGDPDAGRLYGGYDKFFFDPEPREHRPGLRIQVEYAFVWSMKASEIARYGAFVAGLLASLEESGFDLIVDTWIPLDNQYLNDGGVRNNTLIRVKRENEISDFTEWSALFSPAGFRQLGFLSICLGGDKVGKTVGYSYGTTIGGKDWGIEYDAEQGLVKINVDQRGSTANLDKMREDAQKYGLLPRDDGEWNPIGGITS